MGFLLSPEPHERSMAGEPYSLILAESFLNKVMYK